MLILQLLPGPAQHIKGRILLPYVIYGTSNPACIPGWSNRTYSVATVYSTLLSRKMSLVLSRARLRESGMFFFCISLQRGLMFNAARVHKACEDYAWEGDEAAPALY